MATLHKSEELIELSPADKDAMLLQLERLVASPHFKNSRRYTDLLRYVVQQTLDGHADTLKERTLGIEVFGREPGFDTAGDSIVRVAAAEVRKRIAQYYQEEGHEDEPRVDLPSGSYVAHFRRAQGPVTGVIEATETSAILQTDPSTEHTQTSTIRSRRMRLGLVAGSLLVMAFALVAEADIWAGPQSKGTCSDRYGEVPTRPSSA
jgi:hypothetical protein